MSFNSEVPRRVGGLPHEGGHAVGLRCCGGLLASSTGSQGDASGEAGEDNVLLCQDLGEFELKIAIHYWCGEGLLHVLPRVIHLNEITQL